MKKVLPHGVYRNEAKYNTAPTSDDVYIYQFTGPIFFGNKDRCVTLALLICTMMTELMLSKVS